jgi:hypothetical protein
VYLTSGSFPTKPTSMTLFSLFMTPYNGREAGQCFDFPTALCALGSTRKGG